MKYKLKQLQHALLLAQEKHFGKAADLANLSQSAFSRSISNLEARLGLILFERGGSTIRLSANGSYFLEKAARLVSSAKALEREIQGWRTGKQGEVMVGAGAFSASVLMSNTIAQLHNFWPDIRMRLEISTPQLLLKKLLHEELDFLVCDKSDLHQTEGLQHFSIGTFVGRFFVRPQHPLARRSAISLEELKGQRFASVQMPTHIAQRLAKIFDTDENGRIKFCLECDSVMVLREYMLRQDVLVAAPPRALELECKTGQLIALNVPELDELGALSPLRMDLALVKLQNRTSTRAAGLLEEMVLNQAVHEC